MTCDKFRAQFVPGAADAAMLEHIRHTAAAIEGTREAPAPKRRAVKKAPSGATRSTKRAAGAKGAA